MNTTPIDRRLTRTDLSPDQRSVYESILDWTRSARGNLLTVGGVAGSGKGQPLDANVITPFGHYRIGDLKVGSQVCNPDGTVAKVLLIHELGERDVFRVTFSDDASTIVTDDHLWLCKRAGKPKYKADRRDLDDTPLWGRLETTSQLRSYIATQVGKSRTYLPLVPLTKPVCLESGHYVTVPIDPYVLGVLLGDGGLTTNTVMLTTADTEIVHTVQDALGSELTCNGRLGYRIPSRTGVREALAGLDLMGRHSYEKHVPIQYMRGSVERRFAVLQGLFDTDGTVDQQGCVSFTTTSSQLASDVQWLLRSCGYRALRTDRIPNFTGADGEKKQGRLAYTIFVQGRELARLFRLSRKIARCPATFNGGVSEVARRMISIDPVGRIVSRCITVDHPNGLYLTDDFIVTHNSTLLGMFAAETDLKVAYICFTGRASSVLSRKLHAAGVATTNRAQTNDERKLAGRWGHLFYSPFDDEASRPFCGTIHRLIYRPLIDDDTEELFGWDKRDELDRNYDLIVLDEASMVDQRIAADIRRHGVRLLAVGDHGQLPPVMGDGSLMENPMLRLETIHRQAEGSPIIRLSRVLREEGRLDRSLADGQRLVFSVFSDLRRRVLVDMAAERRLDTAFLCYKNATRVNINRIVREYLGCAGKLPQIGEPVIALRNYPPIYNGMRGELTMPADQPYPDEWWMMRAKIEFPDEGIEAAYYDVCRDQFHRHEPFRSVDELREAKMKVHSMSEAGKLFDFGYALTVHKSQGSQFPHAVVVVDWRQDYTNEKIRRLAYTAITRASERLTVLI